MPNTEKAVSRVKNERGHYCLTGGAKEDRRDRFQFASGCDALQYGQISLFRDVILFLDTGGGGARTVISCHPDSFPFSCVLKGKEEDQ